ncbi:MAG: hypothetical protein R3C53_02000 [Pirellulaceae bacterium]
MPLFESYLAALQLPEIDAMSVINFDALFSDLPIARRQTIRRMFQIV